MTSRLAKLAFVNISCSSLPVPCCLWTAGANFHLSLACVQYVHILNKVLLTCADQVDSQRTGTSTFGVYSDQLSVHTTAPPPRSSVIRQSGFTPSQPAAVVQLPSQHAGQRSAENSASYEMPGYLAVMSDGGNSRDSWSSTSSNAVVCPTAPAAQQWLAHHRPPQQPIQYSHQMHQQQHHRVYDWAHRHTWDSQVETNQSRCQQVYPQQQSDSQMFRYMNPRAQTDQRRRSTPSVHPYHHATQQRPTHLPSAAMTHDVLRGQQNHATPYSLPTQLITQQPHGRPASVWNDQRVGTSSAQPVTYDQLRTSSEMMAPWYSLDDCSGTAVPAAQAEQQQQQHAGLLFSNGSDVSLSSNLCIPWSADVCYDNSVNDWYIA